MKPVFISKYEATKHMKRHIQVTTETPPSYETSRWRDPESDHKFAKQTGHQERIDKKVAAENLLLSKRMYDLVTENREKRTTEYAPGWRTGLSGTVIDCYPTAKKQVLNYKKFRSDNRERDNARMQKKLNKENQHFHEYLTSTRTSYGVDELAKEYAKNRVMYKMYANRPHTLLHLGIYDMAVKDLEKDLVKRSSVGIFNNSASQVTTQGAAGDNAFKESDDHPGTGGVEINGKTSRPTTATSNKYTNKIMRKLNEVQTVADFINLNISSIENSLEFPGGSRPKGWNDATNDNLHNSNYNTMMVQNRLKPGYVQKKKFKSDYLRDYPTADCAVTGDDGDGAVAHSAGERATHRRGAAEADRPFVGLGGAQKKTQQRATSPSQQQQQQQHQQRVEYVPAVGGSDKQRHRHQHSSDNDDTQFNLFQPQSKPLGTRPVSSNGYQFHHNNASGNAIASAQRYGAEHSAFPPEALNEHNHNHNFQYYYEEDINHHYSATGYNNHHEDFEQYQQQHQYHPSQQIHLYSMGGSKNNVHVVSNKPSPHNQSKSSPNLRAEDTPLPHQHQHSFEQHNTTTEQSTHHHQASPPKLGRSNSANTKENKDYYRLGNIAKEHHALHEQQVQHQREVTQQQKRKHLAAVNHAAQRPHSAHPVLSKASSLRSVNTSKSSDRGRHSGREELSSQAWGAEEERITYHSDPLECIDLVPSAQPQQAPPSKQSQPKSRHQSPPQKAQQQQLHERHEARRRSKLGESSRVSRGSSESNHKEPATGSWNYSTHLRDSVLLKSSLASAEKSSGSKSSGGNKVRPGTAAAQSTSQNSSQEHQMSPGVLSSSQKARDSSAGPRSMRKNVSFDERVNSVIISDLEQFHQQEQDNIDAEQ